jgi:hypothetical protein
VVALAAVLAAGCGGGLDGRDSQATDPAGLSDEMLARAGAEKASTPSAQPVRCSGPAETISGDVAGVGGREGLTIDTGTAYETIYGLGPSWYWSANGMARPVVRDAIVAIGSPLVTIDERVQITVNGQLLALRDPATCAPL